MAHRLSHRLDRVECRSAQRSKPRREMTDREFGELLLPWLDDLPREWVSPSSAYDEARRQCRAIVDRIRAGERDAVSESREDAVAVIAEGEWDYENCYSNLDQANTFAAVDGAPTVADVRRLLPDAVLNGFREWLDPTRAGRRCPSFSERTEDGPPGGTHSGRPGNPN